MILNKEQYASNGEWIGVNSDSFYYKIVSGVVFVKIPIPQLSYWSSRGTLPAEARPSNTLVFTVDGRNDSISMGQITSGGEVYTYSPASTNVHIISYPLGG